MKLKQLFSAVLLVFTAASFSSCNNENSVEQPDVENGTTRILFSISMPKGDPVIYSRAIHDAAEWGIESLWLYEFDATSGELVADPINIKADLQGTGPTYEHSRAIITSQKGTRRFVFVANEQVTGMTKAAKSTLAQLQRELATKQLTGSSKSLLNSVNGQDRIPMTGEARLGSSPIIAVSGGTQAVKVELVRIVARIDVTNAVPNLVITGLTLANTNNTSILLPATNTSIDPAGNQKVSNIAGFATLPSPFNMAYDGGSGSKGLLAKAFYLYEGVQPSEIGAVRILVRGKLGGVDVFYNIPFWKNGAGVTVKRNHIYRLVLGDGETPAEPNTMVQFTLEDTPWNEMLLNEEFSIISAVYSTAVPTNTGVWDSAKQVLSITNAAHSGLAFNFSTRFAGHTAFTATVVGSPQWLTATFASGSAVLSVNAQANTTGAERTAVIEVSSNVDPATKYQLSVKQAL